MLFSESTRCRTSQPDALTETPEGEAQEQTWRLLPCLSQVTTVRRSDQRADFIFCTLNVEAEMCATFLPDYTASHSVML
jgi:hypothetical protein